MVDALHKLHAWHPPVGVFIAILAVLGVLVPWFRGAETTRREKAFWTAVMFALLGLELRSIVLFDQDQRREEDAANERFSGIVEGLKDAMKQSQEQFQATMDEIRPTLEASTRAARNTAPVARIEIREMSTWPRLLPMTAAVPMKWRIWYTNVGSLVAKNTTHEETVYIGPPTEREQQRIAEDFDQWWDKSKHESHEVNTSDPRYFEGTSNAFTANQIAAVDRTKAVVYAKIRFTWQDSAGQWATDRCFYFETSKLDFAMVRPCLPEYNRQRYAFKDRSPHK